jgi:fucose permease
MMITFYLLFLQMNWRRSLNHAAIAVFVLAAYFLFARLKSGQKEVDSLSDRLKFLRQQKLVFILFLATICATGLEICLIGIMTTFLMELRDFSQVTSKIALIIFLSGLALGRLLVGLFTKREGILNLIIFFFGLSTLILTGLFVVNAKEVNYVLVFMSGASISALFPLLITLGGIMFKDMPGTVLGIIKLALPVGGILIPILLSVISKYGSLQLALMLFPLIALTGFVIMFFAKKALPRAA